MQGRDIDSATRRQILKAAATTVDGELLTYEVIAARYDVSPRFVRRLIRSEFAALYQQCDELPKRYLPFNINHNVRVKLTDAGRAWHRKRHAEWFANAPHIKYTPPTEDGDGWSLWQMHRLMEIFGNSVGIGQDLLFETKIELDISEQ